MLSNNNNSLANKKEILMTTSQVIVWDLLPTSNHQSCVDIRFSRNLRNIDKTNRYIATLSQALAADISKNLWKIRFWQTEHVVMSHVFWSRSYYLACARGYNAESRYRLTIQFFHHYYSFRLGKNTKSKRTSCSGSSGRCMPEIA